MVPYFFVLFLLLADCISAASSANNQKFLLLHSKIASDGPLIPKIEQTDVYLEASINDPALCYLCKTAFSNRIALYSTRKFAKYLRGVGDVAGLLTYLQTTSLKREDVSNVIMFLKDVLLLVAVLECKEIIGVDERLQVLGRLVSLVGEYVWENNRRVKLDYTFTVIDESMESSEFKPIPFKAPQGIDAVSVQNVQRLLHLMETYYPNVYDLTNLCKYLDAPTKNEKTLTDSPRTIYLKRRVKEECLREYVTSSRHAFGYVFMLSTEFAPTSLLYNTLIIIDQMTFQLNHLFQNITKSTTRIAVEFAETRKNTKMAKYLNKWLEIWSIAFKYGLTEVIDYQVLPNDFQTIRRKLNLLLSYYHDDSWKLEGLLNLFNLLLFL